MCATVSGRYALHMSTVIVVSRYSFLFFYTSLLPTFLLSFLPHLLSSSSSTSLPPSSPLCAKAHSQGNGESELIAFDAAHECRRKQQLERLLGRTREQVAEEEVLLAELKKIETRKKEREKKQHDLQKLISAAEQNVDRFVAIVGGVGRGCGLLSFCTDQQYSESKCEEIFNFKKDQNSWSSWCTRYSTATKGV